MKTEIEKLLRAQQSLAEVVALGILPEYELKTVKNTMRVIVTMIKLLENRKKVLDNRKLV